MTEKRRPAPWNGSVLVLGGDAPVTPLGRADVCTASRPAPTDVNSRLAALEADVADIKARLVHSRLTRADRGALARILPAIVGALGPNGFLAGEAVQLAAVQLVIPGWKGGRLGKLLKRAVDVAVDGLTVERLGTEGHALVWRVVGILPEFPSSGNSNTVQNRRRGGLTSRSEDKNR